MKEILTRILFALWLRFGLSLFDQATVSAPNGKILSVLFHFRKFTVDGNWTSTADTKWNYASNGEHLVYKTI